jgi:hypothetical protein
VRTAPVGTVWGTFRRNRRNSVGAVPVWVASVVGWGPWQLGDGAGGTLAAWLSEEFFAIFHFEQRTTEGVGLNDLVQGK